MKFFILTLFLSFSSLHCAKKDSAQIVEPNEIAIKDSTQTVEPNKRNTQCITQDCNEDLLIAISKSNFKEAQALLEDGVNPNHRSIVAENNKLSAIHVLAFADDEQGSIEFLPKLIEYGADINTQDDNGDTALMYAIENEKYLLVQKLLQNKNIDISKKNNANTNIIQFFSTVDLTNPLALQTFNKVLSKSDANMMNAKNKDGYALIHFATYHKHIKLLKALAPHPNININIQDNRGKTPIFYSLSNIYVALYEALYQTEEIPTASQLEKLNQVLQVLLSSPHEIDLTIEDDSNISAYGVLLFIKVILKKIPQDSPLYPAIKAIKDTIDSIDVEQELMEPPTTTPPQLPKKDGLLI